MQIYQTRTEALEGLEFMVRKGSTTIIQRLLSRLPEDLNMSAENKEEVAHNLGISIKLVSNHLGRLRDRGVNIPTKDRGGNIKGYPYPREGSTFRAPTKRESIDLSDLDEDRDAATKECNRVSKAFREKKEVDLIRACKLAIMGIEGFTNEELLTVMERI